MRIDARKATLIETLEGRRLLSGTTTSALVSSVTATPAVVVARPAITPILGNFDGDLIAGSTLDFESATGQFKLVLSQYNSSTGIMTGKVYITVLTFDGVNTGSYVVPFSEQAHATSAGGFDIHVTGRGFNAKLKGDYKRNGTYISGTFDGTYDYTDPMSPSTTLSRILSLDYDIELRS
jgi:hypothetical protein